MSKRAQDRLFTATGIAFVVLQLVGFGLGGPTHQLTVTSTTAKLAETLGKPAGTISWVGAYLDLLSVGAFLAFAIWACTRLGGGLAGQIGRAAATSYATVMIASLALMDTIGYRAGHGLSVSVARTLVTANEALFVGTWFLSAFFLLAVGALALRSPHRILGWSAIAIALFTLVATAISVNNLGQFSILLFFGWTVGASITLGRAKRAPASSLAAQHA
jgi:hypothetical protein